MPTVTSAIPQTSSTCPSRTDNAEATQVERRRVLAAGFRRRAATGRFGGRAPRARPLTLRLRPAVADLEEARAPAGRRLVVTTMTPTLTATSRPSEDRARAAPARQSLRRAPD